MSLTDIIKAEARAVGFDAVGVTRVGDPRVSQTLSDRLVDWLRRGYHATMAWMARDPRRRTDPSTVLPGCRSIICVGLNYYTEQRADEAAGHGRIARYAWGGDYHRVLGDRLKALSERLVRLAPEATVRWYVDTGPIMEKAWAQQAGLGWIGKHSNLVSPQFGSWLLLGELLTTLELHPDEPGADLCGSCRLCVTACPTGAIIEPYIVDAGRCISYLTIEAPRAGEVPDDDLRRFTGNRLFGCDDCLDICPYNVNATSTDEPAFQGTADTLAPDLAALAQLSEPEFASRFKDSPIRRTRYPGFLTNVATARANATSAKSP